MAFQSYQEKRLKRLFNFLSIFLIFHESAETGISHYSMGELIKELVLELKLKEIEEIYHAALEKKAGPERLAYLDAACKGDAALRKQIEALLKANEESVDFLENPVLGIDISLEESPLSESPGTVIGRYKLLERIGEGGMAVVYMAEQTEPIRRKVALKIIKLGMDTKSVIARFEAERQALAMMDHPNIAKVLDAGATETGRPYFVMELVKGTSITDFCDINNLSTQKRLELFVRICNAVQHAHQKGIIHRDIKPSNVMVTLHDGKPVPKVIDFGIAKAINRRLTEKTLFTRYAQMIGTPTYMSPEQAEMSDLDIDIRSDVYSLGTLLYELLIGTTPFDSEYLLSKGYGEIQRIIREEMPTKPSTKISTMGAALVKVAEYRNASPDDLRKQISTDIDWIVMKTLEKDRDHRYSSVSEFAADIKRYLNNEPVLAGPPSATYRIKKFIKRHRVLVAASITVAAVVMVGFVISTILYIRMSQALNKVSQLENKAEVDSKLSTAQRLYSEGRYQVALNEIEAMLNSQNLGPKAELLRAQILFELGQGQNAENQLFPLTKAESEIAGAAYSLLAQINIGTDEAKAKEYESLAASMLPQTAEAYSLRAMTSTSPEKALQWLDKAIELDPSHYPSRKARVLIYYGLDEIQKMNEDVEALIALRPADSLGYAIRAILRQELGQLKEAAEDLTLAIDLCDNKTELSELHQQRYETYTTMGDHSSALADARYCAELDPQEYSHRFKVFRSFLELKDFDAAKKVHRSIVQTNPYWDLRFNRAAAIYLFDILIEGHSFTIPPNIAGQTPFAQMQRVAQCYQTLENKAKLLHAQQQRGYLLMDWSPDGKELLCGMHKHYGGITGEIRRSAPSIKSGLKIINIESGQERHITSAFTLRAVWSPDGEYIAFTDPNRHICIAPANGGQLRRLISGIYPQWSKDSKHLYLKNKLENNWQGEDVCIINIDDPDLIPQKVIECPGCFAINEDENWIAYDKTTGIDIVDLSSGALLYEFHCPWPIDIWSLSLSPDGRELYFRTWWSSIIIGPIIFDTREKQLYRVLDYPVDQIFRSTDGTKLAVGTRPTAWIMEVDPNIPVCQFIGQKIPGNDLIADEIKRLSQEIATDPLWPKNYIRRAIAYTSIDQYRNAESDLQQFETLTVNDNHLVYETFWWLRQCYKYELYKQAEFLFPCAERLMIHFPEAVSSYRDLIEECAEINAQNGKIKLAERWKAKLQDSDKKDM
jgi:serine/threonine protein kinase